MTVTEFSIILFDTYKMDLVCPPLYEKNSVRFKKITYTQWAIDELTSFIKQYIYPNKEASVEDICKGVRLFMTRMSKYSSLNTRTYYIFQIAYDLALNVLDLLSAMK